MRWFIRLSRDLRDSLLTTLTLTAFSWFLAVPVLGNSFYLSVFLPLLSVLCLTIAWFSHLRRDNFIPPRETRKLERPDVEKPPGADFFASWDEPIIARPVSGQNQVISTPSRRTLTRVLLLTALFLAIASTLLYHIFGIGGRYFALG